MSGMPIREGVVVCESKWVSGRLVVGLRGLLRCLGFGRFRWFKRWCGGCWVLYCDFRTFVVELNRVPCRYPDAFVGSHFEWVLAVECYPG